MSEFRYTSTETRTYVDRALVVSRGDVVDWPDGPPADGHWAPVDAEHAAADEAEQTTVEPPKTTSAPAAAKSKE